MKTIQILVCCLLFTNLTYSQSKITSKHKKKLNTTPPIEETCNWIAEKIDAYASIWVIDTDDIETGYSCKFSNGNFLISYTYEAHLTNSKHAYIMTIPINEINSISQNTGGLYIYTYGRDISQCAVENNYCTYSSDAYIPMNMISEQNLFKRMEKAFSDLKLHFPKKEAY